MKYLRSLFHIILLLSTSLATAIPTANDTKPSSPPSGPWSEAPLQGTPIATSNDTVTATPHSSNPNPTPLRQLKIYSRYISQGLYTTHFIHAAIESERYSLQQLNPWYRFRQISRTVTVDGVLMKIEFESFTEEMMAGPAIGDELTNAEAREILRRVAIGWTGGRQMQQRWSVYDERDERRRNPLGKGLIMRSFDDVL